MWTDDVSLGQLRAVRGGSVVEAVGSDTADV